MGRLTAAERRVAQGAAERRRGAVGRGAAAGVESVSATRREQAAPRAIELAGHDAGDRRQSSPGRALGQSGEQCGGVRMMRLGEQRVGRVLLDLLAGVLDDDAIGRLGDDAHVVGDQHQRHAVALLERQQQVEDLRLDRHVERRRRLVGDEQLRPAGERHRDHHPLAHAARKLVREGAHAASGIGDADLGEQLDDALARARRSRSRWAFSASLIWKPTVKHGFSDDIGSWKIIAMSLPAISRRSAGGHRNEVAAVDVMRSALDLGGERQEAHHREHRHRLARAEFADDRQHLVAVNRHVDPIHRLERAVARGEGDGEIADFEQGHGNFAGPGLY